MAANPRKQFKLTLRNVERYGWKADRVAGLWNLTDPWETIHGPYTAIEALIAANSIRLFYDGWTLQPGAADGDDE